MPIREYQCRECDHEFEVIETSSSTKPVCESCGGRQLERKLSVFASISSGAMADPMPPCGNSSCPQSHACPMEQN